MAKDFISSLKCLTFVCTDRVSSLVFMGNVVELLMLMEMLHSHLQSTLVSTEGYGHRYFEVITKTIDANGDI
jgi:hypothetical protein